MAFGWARTLGDREKRLSEYQGRLAALRKKSEPREAMDRGFHRGSIQHCEEMIRQLNAAAKTGRAMSVREWQRTAER